jgi:cyclopropane-fatty-acyl-phospholipid synthase
MRNAPPAALAGPLSGPWREPRLAILNALATRLRVGRVSIVAPEGERIEARGENAGPEGTLVLHGWSALRRLVTGGAIGFAEAYMDGAWSSPDLAALLEVAAVNLDALGEQSRGAGLLRVLNRLRHRLRDNSRRGSRRNIAAHYDLGNAFYRLWLDAGLAYSSALYRRPGDTLEAAQAAKADRIVELMGLAGGERVLEIGCGWGGLALRLGRAGVDRVTAITLSREQLSHATQAIEAAGLADRVDLHLLDYRDIGGSYDRIASIEMVEAVGEAHWPAYFAVLRDRLAAGGVAVLQAITVADQRFAAYRRGTDFIQRYIFPGGMLPSPSKLREQVERAGLVLDHAETFGVSYALTLAEWQRRFQAAWPAIAALGFGPRFKRMWEYYLAYCEAGFRAGSVDVGLYRVRKPAR